MIFIKKESGVEGFVTVDGEDHPFLITYPEGSDFSNVTISGSWKLRELLKFKSKDLEEIKETSNDVDAFLEKLTKLWSTPSTEMEENFICNSVNSYYSLKHIIEEIEAIRGIVLELQSDAIIIKIEEKDMYDRPFESRIKINQNYPNVYGEVIYSDLPKLPDVSNEVKSLKTYHNVFCQKLIQLHSYFNTIDKINTTCWTLDPVNPSYKDLERRIFICENVSLWLKLDPYNIEQIPAVQLLGCESVTMKYKTILEENLAMGVWDSEIDLIYNLENLLNLSSFPPRPNDNAISLLQINDCAICYLEKLDSETADIICENKNCCSVFHVTCLYQWIKSVSSGNFIFQQIKGECPNCNETIFCPLPKSGFH